MCRKISNLGIDCYHHFAHPTMRQARNDWFFSFLLIDRELHIPADLLSGRSVVE